MVNYQIMSKLNSITEEERELLKGNCRIDRALYMETKEDRISNRLLLENGKMLAIRPHTRFVDFPEHSHDYIEVVYMCSGSTTHKVNGKELTLQEGELLFLSRNARHSIGYAKEHDIAVNFIILPEFFADLTGVLGEEATPLKSFISDCLCHSGGPDFLLFQVAEVLPIQNLIENLIWTLLYDTKYKQNVTRSTMELLFYQLLNCTDALEYTDEKDEAVLSVLRYIEDHYQKGSLLEVAKMLHYNFSWLSKVIKKKTGMTYTELLQRKRLSQSVFYLTRTNKPITTIATLVGYDNVSYFYRVFADAYGMTPKQYRNKNNGK